MIANAAFVATLIFLALGFWSMHTLHFLTPWRSLIVHSYLRSIALYCALLFANILGLTIWIERKFFLRDTGRKLRHFDQEIHTGKNELSEEIRSRFGDEEGTVAMQSEDQYLDRTPDLVAKVRAMREAADREMDRFTRVADYDVRRVVGQGPKAAPVSGETAPAPPTPERPKKSTSKSATAQTSIEFAPAPAERGDDGESA